MGWSKLRADHQVRSCWSGADRLLAMWNVNIFYSFKFERTQLSISAILSLTPILKPNMLIWVKQFVYGTFVLVKWSEPFRAEKRMSNAGRISSQHFISNINTVLIIVKLVFHFRWNHDDKYFACLKPDMISVFETEVISPVSLDMFFSDIDVVVSLQTFMLLDKKSIKIEGIRCKN